MDGSKWVMLPSSVIIQDTVKNLKKRNINVEVLLDREEALERIKEMIPSGASVMTGGSTTLSEIGFTDFLKISNHDWVNWKEKVLLETDSMAQEKLRRESTLADYFLGSVHAVTIDGEVLVASATGSQLPAYTYSSPHVIWVVGIQKIVPDREMAFRRIKEYVLPLEDQRMKKEGYPGSSIGKRVVFEKEAAIGRVTLLFVKEKLGF